MLREKKRYIAVQCKDPKIIEESLLRFFGEKGYSELRYKKIEEDKEKGIVIIRCSNKRAKQVIGAIALINKERCKTLFMSGTIKALKEKLENQKNKEKDEE